jgi:hypothetical protein
MARLLSAEAVLIGRLSSYTVVKELQRAADEGAVYLARQVPAAASLPGSPANHPGAGTGAARGASSRASGATGAYGTKLTSSSATSPRPRSSARLLTRSASRSTHPPSFFGIWIATY